MKTNKSTQKTTIKQTKKVEFRQLYEGVNADDLHGPTLHPTLFTFLTDVLGIEKKKKVKFQLFIHFNLIFIHFNYLFISNLFLLKCYLLEKFLLF